MNGMIGSSGTTNAPSLRVICVPVVGAVRFVNSGIVYYSVICLFQVEDRHTVF